jgi:hypothetical protein
MGKDPAKAKRGTSPSAPDPASNPEPPTDGFSLARLWAGIGTIPKILGGIVAALAALGTLYGTYIQPLAPPNVTMSATCRNDQIKIDLANTGGRAARVSLPRFTIVSAERHDALDLEPYLKERPVGERFELASGHPIPLEFNNPLDFFGKEESRSCRFEIRLPVEGQTEPLLGSCTCTYIDR